MFRVALAGVATEWLRFGHAEGGLADVQQLDRLLQALRFTQVGSVDSARAMLVAWWRAGWSACDAMLCAPEISAPTLLPSAAEQAKADAQVRWAVLNTVTLLRRHEAAHDALAAAMQRRATVGECIAVIEQQLAGCPDI